MKYTIKMILVPEDLYIRLKGNLNRGDEISYSARPDYTAVPEQQSIDANRRQIASIVNKLDMSGDDDNARHIHYAQHFKQMQKMMSDKNERPLRVTFASPLPGRSLATPIAPSPRPPPHTLSSIPRRRRRYQVPARPLALNTPTAEEEESDSYADAASSLDDQQQDFDEEQVALDASPSAETNKGEIQQYIEQNADALGVDARGRIINQQSQLALTTSNIGVIVRHALSRREHGNAVWPAARTGNQSLPVGYARFMQVAADHPFLREKFGISDQQAPSARTHSGRRQQHGRGGKIEYIGPWAIGANLSNNLRNKKFMHNTKNIKRLNFQPELW